MKTHPDPLFRLFWRTLAGLLGALAVLTGLSVWLEVPSWGTALAAAMLAAAFAGTVYLRVLIPLESSRNEEMEKEYAGDILKKQAELDALQSQINPHFLYNTLDSIRGQALAEGAEDIAGMTEALSTFFRYSISNRSHVVTLEEELENVRNYFLIQQFRFNNRFRLQLQPFSRELLESCRLPKLTLQPVLENAILHGMEGKIGPGTIAIRAEVTESRTVLTISDDGAGMSEGTLLRLQARLRGEEPAELRRTRGSGIALPNVSRRIKLLFGEDCGLRVMSTLGLGTDVEIWLPPCGEVDHGA
ncbi:sensor histidine kinase [Oscillospiraceae bacterium 38-13]